MAPGRCWSSGCRRTPTGRSTRWRSSRAASRSACTGRFGIATEFVDERLTSDDAERALRAAGARGARLKAALDPVAAQRILESFLRARTGVIA